MSCRGLINNAEGGLVWTAGIPTAQQSSKAGEESERGGREGGIKKGSVIGAIEGRGGAEGTESKREDKKEERWRENER